MFETGARGRGRRALLLQLVGLALSGVACGGSNANTQVNLPTPIENSSVGPGDVLSMEVMGEKDLPRDYHIATDGTVDLPYLQTVHVAGLEPQQISRLIRKMLMDRQILQDPSVVVQVKEYNSRRVTIMGQVAKPGLFPYTRGMTLMQALSQAGGPTGIANLDKVNLTRRTTGGSRTVVISIGTIMEGRSADIPLQSGDRVFVHERIF